MPNTQIVIDVGPLIALFNKKDPYYHQALRFVESFRGQLISTYPVITEVTHMLDFDVRIQLDFIRWVARGAIQMQVFLPEDLQRILELSEKYADLPMDFADASLVAICERLKIRKIATIDGDFNIYRTRDKKSFRNVFPV